MIPTARSSLPPIEEVFGHLASLPKGKTRQQSLAKVLTAAAIKLKRNEPRQFYSMREVADFFRLSRGTVAVVYQSLERKGLVSRIRGTHTMLTGKRVASRDTVRGVIGISVWLPALMALPYTGTLTIELEEQLRKAGYVADIILHRRNNEDAHPEFGERLLRHRLDAVFLHTPPKGSRQNIFSLRERGVRVIVMMEGALETDLPALTYHRNPLPAMEAMLQRWQQVGIRQIWLWMPLDVSYREGESSTLGEFARRHDLDLKLSYDQPAELLKKLHPTGRSLESGVIFAGYNERICNDEPELLEAISRSARLGFIHGRIHPTSIHLKKVPVDFVEFSGSEIASRLVEDIQSLPMLADGLQHTFLAQYHEQIPL